MRIESFNLKPVNIKFIALILPFISFFSPFIYSVSSIFKQTALSYMCSTNTTHFLEALLQVPAIDINKPDNELNTPLHYAAECGNVTRFIPSEFFSGAGEVNGLKREHLSRH